MQELTKKAAKELYETSLKETLETAFNNQMAEIRKSSGIHGQYATGILKNLIQLSAQIVTEMNSRVTEYLHDSSKIYENYQTDFEQIKTLNNETTEKEKELRLRYNDYLQKWQKYETLYKEFHEDNNIKMEDVFGESLRPAPYELGRIEKRVKDGNNG